MNDADEERTSRKALVVALGTPVLIVAAIGGAVYYSGRPSPEAAEAQEIEKRLPLVVEHGTLGELCETATEARHAWLNAHDDANYERSTLFAADACSRAALDGANMPVGAGATVDMTTQTDH